MKLSLAWAFAGCVALTSAFYPDLTPPKQLGTPLFYLEVAFSPNASLIGQWMWDANPSSLFGGVMGLTSDRTQRQVFYQSANWTTPQHPLGGSVLVRNVSDAVPYNVAGPPYTIRNLIVGGAFEDPQDNQQYLPSEATIGDFSEEEWATLQEAVEMDFRIDLVTHRAHFSQAPGLGSWNKVSVCWHYNGATTDSQIIVAERHFEECSPIEFVWVFADF